MRVADWRYNLDRFPLRSAALSPGALAGCVTSVASGALVPTHWSGVVPFGESELRERSDHTIEGRHQLFLVAYDAAQRSFELADLAACGEFLAIELGATTSWAVSVLMVMDLWLPLSTRLGIVDWRRSGGTEVFRIGDKY